MGYPIIFLFQCLMEAKVGSLQLPNWGILLVVMMIFLGFFSYIIKKRTSDEKMYLINMKSEMMEQNYNMATQLYQANAKEYHDFKNHINILYALAKDGKNEEIVEYIKEIYQPLMMKESGVNTENNLLDIISRKYFCIIQKGQA